jgi:hypothetical protein
LADPLGFVHCGAEGEDAGQQSIGQKRWNGHTSVTVEDAEEGEAVLAVVGDLVRAGRRRGVRGGRPGA